jgi:hypothetical protein
MNGTIHSLVGVSCRWVLAGLVAALAGLTSAAVGAQGTANPHGELSIDCQACHTEAGWTPLKEPLEFDHATTGFPLEAAHEVGACTSCHRSLEFAHVPVACADCHEDPHRGELGVECSTCHTPATWDNRFEILSIHDASLFPLTGVHATVECTACHREGPPFEFSTTPTDCVDCHLADFQSTREPDHVAAGFPTSCQLCHDTITFEEARIAGGIDFDHSIFPLTGAHARIDDCQLCHAQGFSGTPSDCFSCHQQEYLATDDPNHVQAGFPTLCELCHNTNDWEDAELDHDLFFPLTGGHGGLDCEDCHQGGFGNSSPECYSCHRADYEGTDDPDHLASGFSTQCEECHSIRRWEDAELDHDQVFPLTGAHRALDCQACHAGGFAGTPTDCYSCHRAEYEATSDPNHVQAGFPTTCEACHGTQRWEGAELDHAQFFPLTGAHRALDCEACHADGFSGTPRQCVGCHQDDYDQTTDPNHQAAGFPTTCEACHGTQSWEDAELDHDQFFPLTGQHRSLSCEACHAGGFAGTPTDCYACHEDDYEQTTDPNHQAAGFPTTCELCHTPNGWEGATFDHDGLYFPIYSGEHAGEWGDCSDCHVNPNNFGTFSCITCHEHNQQEMDEEHEDVPGYVYESSACYACHPTGEE